MLPVLERNLEQPKMHNSPGFSPRPPLSAKTLLDNEAQPRRPNVVAPQSEQTKTLDSKLPEPEQPKQPKQPKQPRPTACKKGLKLRRSTLIESQGHMPPSAATSQNNQRRQVRVPRPPEQKMSDPEHQEREKTLKLPSKGQNRARNDSFIMINQGSNLAHLIQSQTCVAMDLEEVNLACN